MMIRSAALLAAIAASVPARAADMWSRAEALTVVMVDDRFEPNHLVFHSGRPYALRLENRGKDAHEFTAPAFLRAARLRDRKGLTNGGTEVYLSPGKSTVVFLVPGRPGTFKLTCADHDWDGMVGSITVE